MNTEKVTPSDILSIEKNKIRVFGAVKCGTTKVGGHSVWSTQFGFEKSPFFYVVPESAYYKFWDAQKAACYGKSGIDYFKFKTAAAAANKVNALIAKK